MGIDPVADTLRVMLGKLAQPPADGFLDEPFAVVRQPLQPAKDALALRQFRGFGVADMGPGQGADQRRAPQQKSLIEQITQNTMVRQMARSAAREITRSIFGTSRRR